MNLIGEHTDYNAGLCLPIALPHRTFIALKAAQRYKVRGFRRSSENVAEADPMVCRPVGEGWAAYRWRCLALREAGFDAVHGASTRHSPPAPLGSV